MAYRAVDAYVYDRVRHFLVKRHKVPTRGTRRYTHAVVHGELGVLHLCRVHLGQARDAAILNCDIRGFTIHATRVDPGELMRALTEYQHLMVPIIQRHGGAIDKFMGDGIMATFGAAVTTTTFAADALGAVDDIMDAAAGWNAAREEAHLPVLQVGAAVSTGRIIFGAVGDETRLEYTVIGDAVNRSAKFEKHTKTEKVRALCDTVTYQTALAQGYSGDPDRETRTVRSIDGIDGPVDMVVLAP